MNAACMSYDGHCFLCRQPVLYLDQAIEYAGTEKLVRHIRCEAIRAQCKICGSADQFCVKHPDIWSKNGRMLTYCVDCEGCAERCKNNQPQTVIA